MKVPVGCLVQFAPNDDGTQYELQFINEDTGEIVFHGVFGIDKSTPYQGVIDDF